MEERIIMKKRILAAVLCAAMIMTGCGGSSSAESSASGASASNAQQLEDFDIVLDWYPNAVHSYIYTAIEKGYYAEEGLNVNIQFPSNTNDAISLTAAGKADMGIYYMHDVVLSRVNQNVPVKCVGAISQEPLDIFMALKEKNIKEPKDLIGKTIGEGGTELSEAIIKYLVEQAGGKIEDVNVINVGFDLMSSMTTGNVDATYGCVVNHEVPQMEEEGFEVDYFFPNDYGMPDYYGFIFVTGEKQIEEERDKLAAFLRASKKGFEDMKNDPEGSLECLLSNQNEENFPLSETVETKSMEILLPKMEHDDAPFLSQSAEIWQQNIDWMAEAGMIEEAIPAEEVMEVIDF